MSHERWITEFVNLSGGQVPMRNDTSCQIEGIEKFILLFENNNILEQNEITYLSDWQRNLIFLGVLDNKYDIRIYGGFTKIFLHSKEVICTSKMNGIYILQAKSLVSNSLTAVYLLSDKSLIWYKHQVL